MAVACAVAIEVIVSDDAMRLSVRSNAPRAQKFSPDDLLTALAAANIPAGDALKERVTRLCEKPLTPKEEHLVLEGVAARPPSLPRAVIVESLAALAYVPVKAGQTLARVQPGEPGEPGRDVMNQPVAPPAAMDIAQLAGEGAVIGADDTIVAAIDGIVFTGDSVLRVTPASTYPADIEASAGAIEFAGDIVVKGSVKDGAILRAGGSVYVDGSIESTIHAARDIRTAGVVRHTGRHVAIAGRDLRAHHLDHGLVHAKGDIVVETDILNSRVVCRGRVLAAGGSISASHVQALRGIECAVLGCESQTKTMVEMGTDHELAKLAEEYLPEIDRLQTHVKKVRTTIQPLMQNAKRLTNEQKERATELLFDAETNEAEANRMQARLVAGFDALMKHGVWEITVQKMIYPGVTLRFPGAETVIRLPLKGPITIRANWQAPQPFIVRRSDGCNYDVPMENRPIADDWLIRLRNTLIRPMQKNAKSA